MPSLQETKPLPRLILTGLLAATCTFNVALAQEPATPKTSVETSYTARVTGVSVNLRNGPSTNYKVVKLLALNEQLDVVAIKGEWAQVQLPRDAACWVSSQFVKKQGDGYTIGGKNVNLRVTPDLRYYPIGRVSDTAVELATNEAGATVTRNGFTKIIPPKGAFGWVHSDFLKRSGEGDTTQETPIIKPATKPEAKKSETPEIPIDGIGGNSQGRDTKEAEDSAESTRDNEAKIEAEERRLQEASAFKDLLATLDVELAKGDDDRNLDRVKALFEQFASSSTSMDIRNVAREKVEYINKLELKIAEVKAAKEKQRLEEEKARKEAEEAAKRAEEIASNIGKAESVAATWISDGVVADHGRPTLVPASHALMDADTGEIKYYIRWDGGDLNSLWQKQVRVAGKIIERGGWDKPIIVISKCEKGKIPEVSPETTAQETEGSGKTATEEASNTNKKSEAQG